MVTDLMTIDEAKTTVQSDHKEAVLMTQNVLKLTQDLVAIKSASQISNVPITDFVEELFQRENFEIERLEYIDGDGLRKASLVAKKGEGSGGLGFFSHSDTVPGAEDDWSPYDPAIRDGLLYGRGSCDMKGPLAATIVAAAGADVSTLQKPVYVVVTADEEVGYGGARQVASESKLLKDNWPQMGVVAEPTELQPVYAHKGGYRVHVTAIGRAAHTSTGLGVSANFLIAPFLAEMAELEKVFQSDTAFMNDEFNPPTNGFNMILNDGGCAGNVTAARTECTLSLRTMPNDNHEKAIEMIAEKARKHNLEISYKGGGPFYVSPEVNIVKASVEATGAERAKTVPFGTEATVFQEFSELVVLGPGNIAQAHTVGEFIDVAQLQQSVDVYKQMIATFCVA